MTVFHLLCLCLVLSFCSYVFLILDCLRNELNTDAFLIRFLLLSKCFSAVESHSKYLKRFRLSFLGSASLRPQGKKLDSECVGVSVIQWKATDVWCLL